MIVDSSALVAILRDEPEAEEFRSLRRRQPHPRLRPRPCSRHRIVVTSTRHRRASINCSWTREIGVVPFDAHHAEVAREAYASFGQALRARQRRLNFGDCMTYALAKVTGEPLLFKGDDFTHTDITPA